MKDKRNTTLARLLVDYSIELKEGEHLYLELKGVSALELGKEIIKRATEVGGVPFWYYNDESLMRPWVRGANDAQFAKAADFQLEMMKRADCYIGVRGSDNPFDLADIDQSQIKKLQSLYYKPVHLEERVKRTRWVVLRYPNNAMAQLAETSREAFEEFYFNVCCLDYARMEKAMEPLQELMQATDKVHLKGPGTDLKFSIKGIDAVTCSGKRNIPDGELFTAPVKDSVNGQITFNTPSLYESKVFQNISLTFKDGKIVGAKAENYNTELNKIFDTDEGARYVGEFSLAFNPFVLHPMKDTLFDEKIKGSLHFTPGQCYDEAYNGNQSSIHWDMVLIQREDYGGGEVYFDDKLIRKDGVFSDPDLEKSLSADSLRPTEDEAERVAVG